MVRSPELREAGVVGGEALLEPGVGVVGVAAHFPKAEDVAVDEGDFADEFRAFPRILFRHDDAGGAAVFDGDLFAVNFVGDEDIVIHADVEGEVGGVAVVAFEEDEFGGGLGFDEIGQGEESDAFPFHLELAPGGDAVEIAGVFELGQGGELIPIESDGVFDVAVDFQCPLVERNFRVNAKVQDGPVVDELLPGREAIFGANGGLLLAGHFAGPAFLARDEIFLHNKRC